MSIMKTRDGEFKVTCDGCGYSETIDTQGDMMAFKEVMKENCWASHHRYKNLCEDCQTAKITQEKTDREVKELERQADLILKRGKV
jgi:recombinational DNA repair protein RecT